MVKQGRAQEAEPLLKDARKIFSKALGANHWRTVFTNSSLGACLVAQNRYKEAEPLLLNAHTTLLNEHGNDFQYTQKARQYLADLYTAWGRPEEAAKYAAADTP